jgi:hypothetical protein
MSHKRGGGQGGNGDQQLARDHEAKHAPWRGVDEHDKARQDAQRTQPPEDGDDCYDTVVRIAGRQGDADPLNAQKPRMALAGTLLYLD